MSLITFTLITFISTLSWIILVHQIDKRTSRIKNPIKRQRLKDIYRIASAAIVTITNHLLILHLVSQTHPQASKRDYTRYYNLSQRTLYNTLKVQLLNAVLFLGNWICIARNEGLTNYLISQTSPNLENLKRLVVCPLLEEALFTVLSYHLFTIICYESPGFTFSFITALTFGLAHLHMRSDQVKFILKRPSQGGFGSKISDIVKLSLKTCLVPFIYKLYCNWVMSRVESFLPVVLLHTVCNSLGAPRGDWEGWSGRKGVLGGWVHLVCIATFLWLATFVVSFD